MKYNRASLEDTVNAAKRLKRMSFVYATAYGFTIANSPPPANQRYVRVNKQGSTFYHEPTYLVDTVGRLQ